MPGIWNINSVYNVGSKKLSSKLTFEVGEKFAGRVMRISQNKGEFTIKLLDGWQFIAQLDENLTPEQLEGLLKFQVLGFQDGKLKLKLVRQEDKATSEENNPLNALIKSQGLAKEEIETLKQLVKFNIPLTKENISKYSSIFNFNEKIKVDEKEVDNFINNYIASKNIPIDSEESKNITEKLQSFFKEFKTMKAEDILTFIENDIDLTESNIKAFNRIFKGEESIEKIILKAPVEGSSIEKNIDSDEIVKLNVNNTEDSINKDLKNIAPKEAYVNSSKDKKISVLDMLRKLSGDFEEINDNKSVDLKIDNKVSGNDIIVSKDTVIRYLKDNNINTELITDKDIEAFIELIKKQDDASLKDKNSEISTTTDLKNNESAQEKELGSDIQKLNQQLIKEGLTNKTLRDTIINYLKENNVSKKPITDKDIEAFVELIKNQTPEEFNKQDLKSTNIPFNTTKEIKDFIDLLKKQVPTSSNDKGNEISSSSSLKNEELVQAKELVSNVNKAIPEMIKEGIKEKALDIKDIIKEVILSSKYGDDEGEAFNKVMEFIKGNAAEVKVFNSVSNNYYYMNIPLKVKQDEYECKLIVKDERGKGKKLDSSNIKMIVSVKTLNLGNVDAYIKLQNKNLDIDLKCSKEYIKILDKEKNKLIESLNTIGYNSKVIVSRAIEEVNISTSREFFNSTNLVILDRKV
ncbi:hypothetical protein [Clostridium intestinale]|uniref:Hook-length control protein FliK n=1 Tax=Clostridium intestinale DSM 6191 TaxID=1121320 RepID=A0A1M5ZJQ9_9CLOT|nr:hypothetical protein [Clostridium intestinale]SHI24183.1 hypothetical protein SAMN02745941_02992 [Clostridium intestinale DSM 6191]